MFDLLASAARTASGTSATFTAPPNCHAAIFDLNVTAAGTLVGDLLDVFIQSTPDGAVWDDFVRFTQVLGNGGAKRFFATWTDNVTPESESHAPADGTMSAGVLQGLTPGLDWRVKYNITNGGGTHSFTFAVRTRLVIVR